ncbi:MAG TPA: tetratricopeptide repeat protein [Methylophilaceae bacterium]|jgi:tetratricopeptide (TPR) repeat protein
MRNFKVTEQVSDILQQALVYKNQSDWAKALSLYEQVLKSQPSNIDALYGASFAALRLNNPTVAIEILSKANKANPNQLAVYALLGDVLLHMQDYEEAIVNFQLVLRVEPQNTDVLLKCGNAWRSLKLYEMALECYNALLQIEPDHLDGLYYAGVMLYFLNQYEAAFKKFKKVVELNPQHGNAYNELGVLYQHFNQNAQALACYEQALQLVPNHVLALYNRGNVLRLLNRPAEAIQSYDVVLRAMPQQHEVLNNKGNALRALNRLPEAHLCYQLASQAKPDYADAYWNDALCLLLAGEFSLAWPLYEWRWASEFKFALRHFDQPKWQGQDLQGKTILLYAEQGLGDTLQFCRYASLIKARGAIVLLEVQNALLGVLSGLTGVDVLLVQGADLPHFDFHCPLLSLPVALATDLTSIPARIPYVFARLQYKKKWRQRLARAVKSDKPKIGLVWAGNTAHSNDHNRSIALSQLLPILNLDASFIALQKDLRDGDADYLALRSDIYWAGESLYDFSDTAALIGQLDLVITVDTAVAHLAGAMGKAVWILLPFSPDWRWLLNIEHSPWYPSARLFRQNMIGDWTGAISELKGAVQQWTMDR